MAMDAIRQQPGRNGTESPVANLPASRNGGLDLSLLTSRGRATGTVGEPELAQITFGILPLTDCAPIVIAHAKGLFSKHGIESNVIKFGSWTDSRDGLLSDKAQAAQMLFGMPVAAAVGKLGTDHRPLVIPWILNRNGQGITMSVRHSGMLGSGVRDFRDLARERRDRGRPMVFAMTLQPGTHAMWLRYWLAAGGINPDKDVSLITIPPPMMVANMRAGRLDGFCVGEPWNAKAVEEKLGFTAILSEEIWPDHPEKVLAFAEEFVETNPNSVKAALKALHEASIWCDEEENRDELAAILAEPPYVNCPAGLIRSRLGSSVDCGNGRMAGSLRGLNFSRRECNYPQPKFAVWWLSQFRRWMMLPSAPDYLGVAARVMRTDLYEAAMNELGLTHGRANFAPEQLLDGKVFDPAQPEKYAADFEITSLRKAVNA
jgi:nitrate/nitrite transport system substrate-binding protein